MVFVGYKKPLMCIPIEKLTLPLLIDQTVYFKLGQRNVTGLIPLKLLKATNCGELTCPWTDVKRLRSESP